MMRYMNTTMAAALAVAMSATAPFAQEGGEGGQGEGEATTFDFFADNNLDNEVAYTDFNASMERWDAFGRWDMDDDDLLTRDEFNRGTYVLYDTDRNDVLVQDEIVGMGRDQIFADNMVTWDTDEVGYEDFNTGMANWNTYTGWDADADGMLSREEFNRGIFLIYDVDQNDILDQEETAMMRDDRIFVIQ